MLQLSISHDRIVIVPRERNKNHTSQCLPLMVPHMYVKVMNKVRVWWQTDRQSCTNVQLLVGSTKRHQHWFLNDSVAIKCQQYIHNSHTRQTHSYLCQSQDSQIAAVRGSPVTTPEQTGNGATESFHCDASVDSVAWRRRDSAYLGACVVIPYGIYDWGDGGYKKS